MGEAKPGTDITFTVSKMDRFGNMVETHKENRNCRLYGLFSETLPLSRGNNYISFAAEGEDKTTTVIKQVPQQVKNQLQRMIALPGMGAKNKKSDKNKLNRKAVRSNESIQDYKFYHCCFGHNCDLSDRRVMAGRNKRP